MKKKAKTAQDTTSLAPVIFIFVCTVAYMASGYLTLDQDSRHVPLLAGYVTIFLLICEALKRLFPRALVESEQQQTDEEINVSLSREFTGLLYVISFAVGIFFFGFYVAVPVYLFLAVAYLGGQPVKPAVTVAVVASAIIYVVFELLLETRLYHGYLFS